MKKIVYLSGSRSDYSLMKRTLLLLNEKTDLTIIATAMHISPQFGNTVEEIRKDGFKTRIIDTLLDNDTLGAMAKSIGIGIYGITQSLEEIDPDLVFLEGDRGETLSAAIAAAHLNIPIVHHGGGDTSGSIDNKIRQAISSFSDFHMVGNKESYDRLIRSGIPKQRVVNIGEPGLDDIYKKDFTPRIEIMNKFNINPSRELILLIYHPDTTDPGKIETEVNTIYNALDQLQIPTIAIYANSDAGGRVINTMLEKRARTSDVFSVFSHVERKDFLGLLNVCSLMIGNSSSGIVELPSFRKPFVCIGLRQKNRIRAGNTIDICCQEDEILSAVNYSLFDEKFKKHLMKISNPYGNGDSSEKIVFFISDILEDNNAGC